MKTWRQAVRQTVFLTVAWVILVWATGCSRQLAVPGAGATANSGHLPFDRVSDNSGMSPTAGFTFDGIPVGTEVTIRLQSALSSAHSQAGDSFQAVLDEPMVVAGKTTVPRGTPVTGSVLAAKASAGPHDPGYLRLTLASIAMNGEAVPLQTSSVFAKGGSYEKRRATMKRSAGDGKDATTESHGNEFSFSPGQGDARFSTGRRLSFRLTQPLHLQG
jgi:hypothetical protein